MIVEIRNYHFDPSKLDAYRVWAVEEAVPFLKANLDVVGFFVDNGEPVQYLGSDPMDLKHGAANVTWMIRWADMEQRNAGHKALFTSKPWRAIWEKHPSPNGYLQMEARFTEEV